MDCRKIRRRPSDGSSLPNSSSAVDSSVEKVLAAVLSSLLFTSSSGGYHKVICLNSECKPWIIHIVSLLVILSTYAMEDGQTATSVPHHHNGVIAFTSEQTLLSYPQFPSLPTSSQVELVPIHISFGCDTILLVIVWCLLCFSGVVRGPLSLDSSWYPQSSSQYILYTIYFKLSDLSFKWSSSLSYQDFFHFMCPYNTHLSFSNHYNPWRTYGKAS